MTRILSCIKCKKEIYTHLPECAISQQFLHSCLYNTCDIYLIKKYDKDSDEIFYLNNT